MVSLLKPSTVQYFNLLSNYEQERKLGAISDALDQQNRHAEMRHMEWRADKERERAEAEQHANAIQTVFAVRKQVEAALAEPNPLPGAQWLALRDCQDNLLGISEANFTKLDEKEYAHDTLALVGKSLATAEAAFPDHAKMEMIDIHRRWLRLICIGLIADAFRKPAEAFVKAFAPYKHLRAIRIASVVLAIFFPAWLMVPIIFVGSTNLAATLEHSFAFWSLLLGSAQIAVFVWAFFLAPSKVKPIAEAARVDIEKAFALQSGLGFEDQIVRRKDVRPPLGKGNDGTALLARLKKWSDTLDDVGEEVRAAETGLKARYGDKLGEFNQPPPHYDFGTTAGVEAALNQETDRKIAIEDDLKARYHDLYGFEPLAPKSLQAPA
jgi:hypothetical protein